MSDWDWISTQREGQFLERKGCYDYSGPRKKWRPAKDVAKDVAEALAAMANADGGTVAVGIEDDGTPAGVPNYSQDRLRLILDAPGSLIHPPLRAEAQWVDFPGTRVLVFETDWSPSVHQLSDGRYVLRVGDKDLPFPATDIEAIKGARRRRFAESRVVPGASLDDLDLPLLKELGRKMGLSSSPQELLAHYRLVEPHGRGVVLTLASLLLFAKDPLRWQASCCVDFVKWEGTERRFGPDLNVVKRVRVEGSLPRLIERTFEAVSPHVRERQRLVDLVFEERFEYPTFAWQEAIVNALAHRDYALEGTPVEVWMFDDRVEIRSPGGLVEPVTIDGLQRGESLHASRNPRIARVLTDLGYMRELGEGIPRMFKAMEREGLQPPEFRLEAGSIFSAVLRNSSVYPPETARWLEQYTALDLSPNQRRLLALAHAHGNGFTSQQYQRLAGVDLYAASRDIKDLIRKGAVQLTKKGGRLYEVLEGREGRSLSAPEPLRKLAPAFSSQGYVKNVDARRYLGVSISRASRLLRELVEAGWIRAEGERRGRKYYLVRDIDPSS